MRISISGSIWVVLVATGLGCGGDDDGAGANGQDGGVSTGSSGSSGSLDACKLLSAQDAGELFAKPAKRDADAEVVDPALLGQCQWTYEEQDAIGSVASQSLQFYVWGSPEYHSVPPDSDPLDVGDDGYIKASESLGVDVGWVQGGRAIALSYFSIGANMPTHASKVDAMKTLAMKLSTRL